MQINIIQDYSETITADLLFTKIAKRSEELLNLPSNYVMSVIFCDKQAIHEVNKQYRKIDRPTDVISFAFNDNDDFGIVEDEIELGDIFINIDACKEQALEYGHRFERELGFLFTHGLLHLLGYDHMNPEDEKIMIAKQQEILDEIIPR